MVVPLYLSYTGSTTCHFVGSDEDLWAKLPWVIVGVCIDPTKGSVLRQRRPTLHGTIERFTLSQPPANMPLWGSTFAQQKCTTLDKRRSNIVVLSRLGFPYRSVNSSPGWSVLRARLLSGTMLDCRLCSFPRQGWSVLWRTVSVWGIPSSPRSHSLSWGRLL